MSSDNYRPLAVKTFWSDKLFFENPLVQLPKTFQMQLLNENCEAEHRSVRWRISTPWEWQQRQRLIQTLAPWYKWKVADTVDSNAVHGKYIENEEN